MSIGVIRHPRAVPFEELTIGTNFFLVEKDRQIVTITELSEDDGDRIVLYRTMDGVEGQIHSADACAEEYSGENFPDGGWNQWNRFETRHHEDCTARHPADQFCRDAFGSTLPDGEIS